MFPAKIRKACTAKPHWANIRSTLQNGRSSVCAFICIRLTSAFWLPFAPSPCNREQVGKRKDKTKKKKEERPNYFSRRETDWKKVCSFLLSFSLPLLFFPFFFCSACPRDKAPFFYAELPKLFLTETRFPFMRTEPARVFLTGIEEGQRTLTESPLRLNQQLWHNTRRHFCDVRTGKRETSARCLNILVISVSLLPSFSTYEKPVKFDFYFSLVWSLNFSRFIFMFVLGFTFGRLL